MLDFVQPQVAGYRSCRWWGRSVAILQPPPWNRQNLTMHCGCPRALSFAGQGTAWAGPALSRGWGRAPNPSPIRR